MFRIISGAVCFVFFGSIALGQGVPGDVKSGAQVVWELVNLDNPQQFEKHFSTPEVKDRINAEIGFASIKSDTIKEILDEKQRLSKNIRVSQNESIFNPVVTYYKSEIVNLPAGNQYILYQVETKADDVMFVKLHLKGRSGLTIDEIELIPVKEALKMISKSYLRIDIDPINDL